MNTIGVNISGNKTFATLAEELLARNSQHIHELCTELLTLCSDAQKRAKKLSTKRDLREQCTCLTLCLTAGYRAGVTGQDDPGTKPEDPNDPQAVRYLTRPFRSLGWRIALRTIDRLIERGHHRSQQLKPKPNSTQGERSESAS